MPDNNLAGKPFRKIANELESREWKSPRGKDRWSLTTIKSILTNERYKGDCLLQKSYSEDFLTKKIRKNSGELPQYYVKNSHTAIIRREVFDLVQEKLKNRRKGVFYKCFLSGKLFCSECGGMYGPKVWHSTDRYKRTVWQCNNKYKSRSRKCSNITMTEELVKAKFIAMVNRLNQSDNGLVSAMPKLLSTNGSGITEFSEDLWYALVEQVLVEKDGELKFVLRDGCEVR